LGNMHKVLNSIPKTKKKKKKRKEKNQALADHLNKDMKIF
jgi:hypothetical protein